MARRVDLLCAFVLLLVCCGREGKETAKAEPPPFAGVETKTDAEPDATCDAARAEAIDAYVEAVCKANPGPAVVDVSKAALVDWDASKPGPEVAEGLPIEVSPDGYLVGDQRLALRDLDAYWDDEFEKAVEMAEAVGERPANPRWILIPDARAKTSMVRDLLAMMQRKGHREGGFVFARRHAHRPPPVRDPTFMAEVHKVVDRAPPSDRASALATLATPFSQQCSGVADAFQRMAVAPADARCRSFVGIGQAVVDCECPPFEDALLTFFRALVVGPGDEARRAAYVPVSLDPKAAVWAPPAEQTWSDYAKSVSDPALKRLRVAAP